MRDFLLARNNAGRLVMTTADGTVHEGVTPVRAFPVMAPDRFVAIMSAEGKEILWIDAPAELPEDVRTLIQEEIASREHRFRDGLLDPLHLGCGNRSRQDDLHPQG